MKKRPLALLLLVVGALAGGVLFTRSSRPDATAALAASSASEEAAKAGPRYSFREGETWTIGLRYEAETRASPLGEAGAALDGDALFDGDVELHFTSVKEGRARGVATVRGCHEAKIEVLGRALIPEGGECGTVLSGALVFELDARGRLGAVGALGGRPTLGTRTLEAILADLFVALPDTAAREVVLMHETPRGTVSARLVARAKGTAHVVDGVAEGGLASSKLPESGGTVNGRYHLEVEKGRLTLASVNETVDGAEVHTRMSLDAKLVDVGVRAAPGGVDEVALAAPFSTDNRKLKERLVDERIAGLTAPEVLDAVALASAGGEPAELSRFLWRATALVGKDPALASQVGALASSSKTTTRGRALALDLLAQAGSAEAEAALLLALDSEAARSDRHHPVHIQRVSLLERPSANAVEVALARLADASTEAERGAWLASAGALFASTEDEALRLRLERVIDEGLAGDGETLTAALLAVGNAREPRLASRAEAFVNSKDASVRAAALQAVFDARHPDLPRIAMTGAKDQASLVQRTALRAIDRGLEPRVAVAVAAEVVAEQKLRRDNVRVLLDLLKHHGPSDLGASAAALDAIVEDTRFAAEERAAARTLREALERGGFGVR